MQIDLYNKVYKDYFSSQEFNQQMQDGISLIKKSKRIFFIGNGGSNSICSHMMEDYAKIAGYETYCFSDPALITCFANDYGYENALVEWLKIYFKPEDLLARWARKEYEALDRGFSAIRVSGDFSDFPMEDWEDLLFYESRVNSIIGKTKIQALCTYPESKFSREQIWNLSFCHESILSCNGGGVKFF